MFGKRVTENVGASRASLRQLGRVSLQHLSSCGSLPIRRLMHTLQLYQKLYGESSFFGLVRNFSRRFTVFGARNWREKRGRPDLLGFFWRPCGKALLSASIFSFSVHGIADDEMIEAANSLSEHGASSSSTLVAKNLSTSSILCPEEVLGWEQVMTSENLHVWRRAMSGNNNNGLFEYKCAGRYFDVPACGFYIAQTDLEYRKLWDKLVICLDVVDSDDETSSEVIRWVTHFPFPMSPREYVFVRRACMDTYKSSLVLTSKTVNHPNCPRDERKFVRVDDYYSCMVIKPHTGDFTENGFDYVLTYFDDPKAHFPTFAYNWMVSSGVPGFIQNVYNAAKKIADNHQKQLDIVNRKIYRLPTSLEKNDAILPTHHHQSVLMT